MNRLIKQSENMLFERVDILRNYQGKQYHIFAQQVTLVDCKVMQNFQQFDAKFLQVELIQGSHGCPVFKAELITDKICQYLQKMN